MANIALLDIAERLQIRAPDAPLPHIVSCLREGLRAFCKDSEAYLYRLDPITTRDGQAAYELDTPPQTETVAKLTRVLYNGSPLLPSSEHLLDTDMPGWETDAGLPKYYFISEGMLYIARPPTTGERAAITGTVQLRPTRRATLVDVDFYERHDAAIHDYTLFELYNSSGTPWGDVGMADRHLIRGKTAAEDAKYESRQQNTSKSRLMAYGG